MYCHVFSRHTSSSAKNLTKFMLCWVKEAKTRYLRSICVFLMIITFKPQQFFIGKIRATERCKFLHIEITLKKVGRLFQGYSKAIRFNPLQFRPSMHVFGFSMFLCNSPPVLTHYCDISVDYLTSRSELKLPKFCVT